MPEKDPATISAITYAWLFALAWFGGIVNYIKKIKLGHVSRFNITEFLGDMITSGFSGLITFYLCQASGFNDFATAALVGMSGHMGSRAIFMIENWLEKRFGGHTE